MNLIKVHLDTDIGGDIDDICALALLLSCPNAEITGITTVLEDQGRRAGYARYALALAGRDEIPVAAGADVRLGCFGLEAGLPPEERYWPEPVRPSPGPLEAALELLKQGIEQEAVIAGIGPFTNLSLLEHRYPGILAGATLCLMAGSIKAPAPGFPASGVHGVDFNVQADSGAAKHVLESADPTLVPIEVTVQTALRRSHLPRLRQSGPLGQLISRQAEAFAQDERIAERHGRRYARMPHDIISFQHDPLTCAVALGWDGVTVESLPLALEMENGQLRERIDMEGRPLRVVTSVDRERFNTFWLDSVALRPSSGS